MTFSDLLATFPRLLGICGLTALSGLVSASETALFALTRQQLQRFRRSRSAAARTILRLRNEPSELLSTVLLANITVNILLYSMLSVSVVRLGESTPQAMLRMIGPRAEIIWQSGIGLLLFLLVLSWAEIIPKLIAFTIAERLAPLVALPLRLLEIITFPVRALLGRLIVDPLTRVLSPSAPPAPIRAEELQELLSFGQQEGLIEEHENVLLHQLMELSQVRVNALMIPRVDVVAFDLSDETAELLRLIKISRLLRIPVYEGRIDDIRGFIPSKEFLLNPQRPLRELIRPVHYIPEQADVEALLRHFRTTQTPFALVVDEYGGLAGVVSLEDVVEEIVGELRAPEERTEMPPVLQLDETTYLVDGGLDLSEFCRALRLPLEESRMTTLGGRIAEILDRLPETGDEVTLGGARIAVQRMKGRRVRRAVVHLAEPVPENPDLKLLMEEAPEHLRSARLVARDTSLRPKEARLQ